MKSLKNINKKIAKAKKNSIKKNRIKFERKKPKDDEI
jgi:hypothetical protein